MNDWQWRDHILYLQNSLQAAQNPEVCGQYQNKPEQRFQQEEDTPWRGLPFVLVVVASVHTDKQERQTRGIEGKSFQCLYIEEIGIAEHAIGNAPEQREDDK